MKYIILIIYLSFNFSQSLLDRLIVPVYLESEFSYGYDDNYLKLSVPERKSDLKYRLGDSSQIDSHIGKNKIKILYIPYVFSNHETKFDFAITNSNYYSSNLKSYKNYYFKLSQNLAPYTWFKFSYSYIPSFYIKSYSQGDPYILYDLNQDSYMPSMFSSEKIGFELSFPIRYLKRTYFSAKYLFESQYYNSDFIEFDLEIYNYYLKIRKKVFKKFNVSVAYMGSIANNISYMNGLLSTADKDRGYNQHKLYVAFSIQKFRLLNFKSLYSCGIYAAYESREFLSLLEQDKLHFMRSHDDMVFNYWLKGYLNNHFDIKIKAITRNRNTSSPYDIGKISVSELKSFEKIEFWFSLILKMEVNVY